MSDNRIRIGKNDKNKRDDWKEQIKQPDINRDSRIEDSPEPIDEAVWGNDHQLNKQFDEEILVEKRRFVRVRLIQQVQCKMIGGNPEEEPLALQKPFSLSIFDISLRGIGTICPHSLEKGTILYFDMILDGISYSIGCEVAYCIDVDGSFRTGLRIVKRDRGFLKHLKIFVARLSLTARYGPRI